MKNTRMKRTLTAAALAVGLTWTLATPASASQYVDLGRQACNAFIYELVVASQTTGGTVHQAGTKYWDKGYKNNAGATTYTGSYVQDPVKVTASIVIKSAGVRCAF